MSANVDPRWVTSTVLVALAGRSLRKGDTFTSQDLRAWVPGLRSQSSQKTAIGKLLELGFLTSCMALSGSDGGTCAVYTVTAEGVAGMQAAALGPPRTSGPRGAHSKDRTVGSRTFAARLWALLRVRGMIDPDTAAATLIDAGGDVQTARKNAQRYLRRWAGTGAIVESRLRTTDNFKRYVLVSTSTLPPAWTDKAQARSAAAITAISKGHA